MALYIGIDGCKEAWIAAILENGKLRIEKHKTIADIMKTYPHPDVCLIDMAIGLPENEEEDKRRPDSAARKVLGKRHVTVFSVPCRQAVEIEGENVQGVQKEKNKNVLKRSLTQQSLAIIPKIRELDRFLDNHAEYRDTICESHPEVCFARLNGGEVIETKKSKKKGIDDRKDVLNRFVELDALTEAIGMARKYQCHKDDIVDAVCLAITARLKVEGKCEVLPDENSYVDAKGLKMQMVVPKRNLGEYGKNRLAG